MANLIFPQCITNAGKPEPGYRKLAIATAIFVAVASPHSSSDDTAIWTFPQRIVRAQRHSARAKNTTEADARKLSKLCENFEKVAVDLPLSILSVCEDKEVPSKSFVKKLLARRSLLLGSTRAWTAASTFLVSSNLLFQESSIDTQLRSSLKIALKLVLNILRKRLPA